MPCRCTPQELLDNQGHIPGCMYHRAPAVETAAAPAPATVETEEPVSALTRVSASIDGEELPPPTPSRRAPYEAPTLSAIKPGHKHYPIVRACELLVRARGVLSRIDGTSTHALDVHIAAETKAAIDAFLGSDAWPAFLDEQTEALDEELAATITDTLSRQPGSVAGTRAQRGAVMPQPPPPPPAFVPPPPRATRSPPYSNGCAHPGTRLQPNGRGMTCLDCATDFPGFTGR